MFSLKLRYSFGDIMTCVLCVASRLLIGQNRQKCSWYRHISIFQLIHLENYSCECFDQVRKWSICSFRSMITLLLNRSISSSKHLCLNLMFVPKIQGLPKKRKKCWTSLILQLTFLQKNKVTFFHIGPQSNTFYLYKRIPLKSYWLCSLRYSRDRPLMPKEGPCFGKSRL